MDVAGSSKLRASAGWATQASRATAAAAAAASNRRRRGRAAAAAAAAAASTRCCCCCGAIVGGSDHILTRSDTSPTRDRSVSEYMPRERSIAGPSRWDSPAAHMCVHNTVGITSGSWQGCFVRTSSWAIALAWMRFLVLFLPLSSRSCGMRRTIKADVAEAWQTSGRRASVGRRVYGVDDRCSAVVQPLFCHNIPFPTANQSVRDGGDGREGEEGGLG